jgi:predicted Zn-dependent protease
MAGPVGPDESRRILDAALEAAQGAADGADALVVHEWGGLTRFAESAIHQSSWREDFSVKVRVAKGGRLGVSSTNQMSEAGAREAAADALEMARFATPDPLFPGFAPPRSSPPKEAFDQATARTSPARRAEGIAELVAQCDPAFRAAGSFETGGAEVAFGNTEGQYCYGPSSNAAVTALVSGGDSGAGYSESWSMRAGDLDLGAIGRRAAEKAQRSQDPRPLPPGRYEVILEPAAVATLVAFLAYMGFGGRALVEGRSCLSGKAGREVAAASVSISDDPLAAGMPGIPFDFEGTPKRRLELIEAGVFLDGVYDRRSAKQAGRESTGHALPPPNPGGPFPLNLSMAPGRASIEDMVRATSRGLLVTRFHYSNIVHPIESTITGMTRDGTWLVENGEISQPVRNFRFTQSILEALRAVEMVGRDTEMVSEFFFSASRVPALKIASFNFTGASDH